jgi:hypothetical protein
MQTRTHRHLKTGCSVETAGMMRLAHAGADVEAVFGENPQIDGQGVIVAPIRLVAGCPPSSITVVQADADCCGGRMESAVEQAGLSASATI